MKLSQKRRDERGKHVIKLLLLYLLEEAGTLAEAELAVDEVALILKTSLQMEFKPAP